MKKLLLIAIVLQILCLSSIRAEDETPKADPKSDPVDQLQEPVKETRPEVTVPPALEAVHEKENGKDKEKWSPSVGKLLTVGVRVDTSFTGGGAIQQGFSIPSVRLSAFGEAGKNVDYRLSLGQTREFSTALMPQLLPTEAYIDLATNPPREGAERDGADLRLRTGMMAPLFNPWWTADLGDLKMIDYHETHKAIFVSRELGAELAFRPLGENLTLAVGVFNGSGIVSQNTNNAKAMSAHIHAIIPLGSVKLGIGNGSYYSEQSTPGSINYKKSWISDFFLYLEITSIKALVAVDAFASHFEDPTRAMSPNGSAVMAIVPLASWISAFGRLESASDSFLNGKIQNLELGPMLELSDYVKAFFMYQALTANASSERSVQVRLRLTI